MNDEEVHSRVNQEIVMFDGTPDYRDHPENYILEELSRPDEVRMLARAGEVACQLLNQMQNARCLDLCCGPGLSMERLVNHTNVIEVVGVDISAKYLEYAARSETLTRCRVRPRLIQGDAVTVPLPANQWDLIMLSSAYHHIENDRKVHFLRRVSTLLSPRGSAVIAENILPYYRDNDSTRDDYRRAVREFYTAVQDTAVRANPNLTPFVKDLIRRPAQYGYEDKYEYKVHWRVFENDVRTAGLVHRSSTERVWPDDDYQLPHDSGNFVIVVGNPVNSSPN